MEIGVVGLFFSAFLSATLLPGTSEAALLWLVSEGEDVLILVVIATAGNVLGALVNFWIGKSGSQWLLKKVLRMSDAAVEKAGNFYQRYGVFSLLFSWLPIIGDPLTVAAGLFHLPASQFIPLVTIGKLARYAILGWGWHWALAH